MDRLNLIEVIAAEFRAIYEEKLAATGEAYEVNDPEVAYRSGRIADAIIRRIGLRSLRAGGSEPEGGTMPSGPWTGSP